MVHTLWECSSEVKAHVPQRQHVPAQGPNYSGYLWQVAYYISNINFLCIYFSISQIFFYEGDILYISKSLNEKICCLKMY